MINYLENLEIIEKNYNFKEKSTRVLKKGLGLTELAENLEHLTQFEGLTFEILLKINGKDDFFNIYIERDSFDNINIKIPKKNVILEWLKYTTLNSELSLNDFIWHDEKYINEIILIDQNDPKKIAKTLKNIFANTLYI